MTALHDWFQTPPGQTLLAWEQRQCQAALADVFGYHALQLGLPDIDTLAANRMPHRWLAVSAATALPALAHPQAAPAAARVALAAAGAALPFAEASLDLVVLPHTLELAADPHASLREVHRVLVHEGHVFITGLNPASLWGLRQRRARLWQRVFGNGRLFLPDAGEFIGPWRLCDWLRLLGFEVESVHYGCYQPATRSARRLARAAWLERLGTRWWPIFGAGYAVLAVKRAHGARLLGTAWKAPAGAAVAPVSVANRVSRTNRTDAAQPQDK
ncbi:methyltransferase domain-containing protein [Comamonadaceae bacterium OH2545_COT-014]|nr:methyltransferase domain-containing protein [Comamonadaceae bacterium OH2545_COT-014]